MRISLTSRGGFDHIESFLKKMRRASLFRSLDSYGREGVAALQSATPVDSGETAASWYYKVSGKGDSWEIAWYNSNSPGGVPVAILLQMGHGTGTGGYVQGYDYINPSIKPTFDRIAKKIWKAVTSA